MKETTRAAHTGRRPHENHGAVNPPIYRASTILRPTYADYMEMEFRTEDADATTYAVHGTPGTFAFEEAVTAMQGGFRTRLASNGLLACTGTMTACLGAGDHLLIADNIYYPSRRFAERTLRRMGVEVEFFDPLIGAEIAGLMRETTRLVFLESPGSVTFEVSDLPAIAAAAHGAGALVGIDNTWASPLYYDAFGHGADLVVHAATKYISGHSDLILGTVTATEAAYPLIRNAWKELGISGPPDDSWLALRGLRTLPMRMAQHWTGGLSVAEWLESRDEIARVIHPALPSDPGHALWQRDFTGASSLFGFVLADGMGTPSHLAALLDGLKFFGMGASWGGFESLLVPHFPKRSSTSWPRGDVPSGQLMRIHIGLEDPEDLIADLGAGLDRLRAV